MNKKPVGMYTTKISYYFDGAGHRRRRSDLEIGAAFSRKNKD